MKILDMHCDTIMALMDSEKSLKSLDCMINLDKLKKGDYLLQCFAMFVPYVNKDKSDYSPFDYCNKMIERYYQEIKQCSDVILPVFNIDDINTNIRNNKMSALLTIEEGGTCLGSIENLRHFYNLGVRMMTITWNFKNELASPNIDFLSLKEFDPTKPEPVFTPNTEDGLTETGIRFIKEMNKLGMVIDCSHASDKTFYDVIKYSNKPIVCSHSCARSVCNHVRNMSDDMLLKLKENGGVVGVNYCHDFIKNDKSNASIEDVVEHINYIKDLIGIDYIGLGSDFDGIENNNIELKDASYMPQLLDELRKQGYSETDLDKITHLNVLRVLKENFH